ncbi:MAG: hypothetical protein QM628_15690 [Propionicimonas sp.]
MALYRTPAAAETGGPGRRLSVDNIPQQTIEETPMYTTKDHRWRILAIALAAAFAIVGGSLVTPAAAYANDTDTAAESPAVVEPGPAMEAKQTDAQAAVKPASQSVDPALALFDKLYTAAIDAKMEPLLAARQAATAAKLSPIPGTVQARIGNDQTAYLAWSNAQPKQPGAVPMPKSAAPQSLDGRKPSAADWAAAQKKVPRYKITGGTARERAQVAAVIKKYKVKVPRGTRIKLTSSHGHQGTAQPGYGADWTISHNGFTFKINPAGSITIRRSSLRSKTLRTHVVLHEIFHLIQYERAGGDRAMRQNAKAFGSPSANNWRSVDLQADCFVWAKAGRKTALIDSYLRRYKAVGKCTAGQRAYTRSLANGVR